MMAALQGLRLVHLLVLMCAPPLLALLLSALLGLRGMAGTHAAAEAITEQTLPSLSAAMQVATLMQSDAALVLRATAVYDDKDKDALLAQQAGNAGRIGKALAVLGEVRLLAQRSAEAAKEIKTLIADSVGKVEEGNRQVVGAGQTMQEVQGRVQKVNDLIAEIAHAADEQSSGIAQVNASVGEMDRGTQQNAALVEEIAAAAQSLKTQADALAQAVAVFRI